MAQNFKNNKSNNENNSNQEQSHNDNQNSNQSNHQRHGMSREEAGRMGGKAPHTCRGRQCDEDKNNHNNNQ